MRKEAQLKIRAISASCLLILIAIAISICLLPAGILMAFGHAKDNVPEEYSKFVYKLLGASETTSVNLSPEDAIKFSEAGIDPVKLAYAIEASKWESEHHQTNVTPGIIYSIDAHEWNGGANPGSCDGIQAAMGNKNLNPYKEESSARALLKIWQEFNVRQKGEIQSSQIYPDYSGFVGHCSAGESGPGFIPTTAHRVCQVGLIATGDPSVADCDFRDHATGSKAVAYEVGRMCPNGVDANCLRGWNQLESWRQTLVSTATEVDTTLGISIPSVVSESHQDVTGGNDFVNLMTMILEDFDLLPETTFHYTKPVEGDYIYVLYGHMSQSLVSAGQTVKKGDLLGFCGITGNITGAHVHLGTSNLHPDDFSYYHQYEPGWFDPNNILGTDGWLDNPVKQGSNSWTSQEFGEKFTDKSQKGHPGKDVACSVGTPLVAVADGKIVPTNNGAWTSGFGIRVILEVRNTSTSSIKIDGWAHPFPGANIGGHPFGKEMSTWTHWGIDMSKSTNPSDWLFAMHSGTVVYAEFLDRKTQQAVDWSCSGNTIAIEGTTSDGHQVWTVYCHGVDDSIQVKVGQPVTAGDQIMIAGDTGNTTGIHLHLGMKIDGQWVDPSPYIKNLEAGEPLDSKP